MRLRRLTLAAGVAGRGARLVLITTWLCVLLLAGCASPGHRADAPADLTWLLRGLSSSVNAQEATLTAETACAYCLDLAWQYRIVRPPIWHNVLVNVGLRRRGLCYQWADDLSDKLESLGLQTLIVRRGAARLNTRREHSSVVLTAREQPFEQGIVLDAWRHSGRLYWCGVKEDKYPWIEVEVVAEGTATAPASSGNSH